MMKKKKRKNYLKTNALRFIKIFKQKFKNHIVFIFYFLLLQSFINQSKFGKENHWREDLQIPICKGKKKEKKGGKIQVRLQFVKGL